MTLSPPEENHQVQPQGSKNLVKRSYRPSIKIFAVVYIYHPYDS